MVGEAYRAALGANIPEAVFWSLTPFRLGERLKAHNRQATQAALLTGWFSAYMAGQERLSSPAYYVRTLLDGEPAQGAQDGEAEAKRWAAQWGLKVEDAQ